MKKWMLFLLLSGLALAQEGIPWYGTWDDALIEARRSRKPILLVSAAPHCRQVSGVW